MSSLRRVGLSAERGACWRLQGWLEGLLRSAFIFGVLWLLCCGVFVLFVISSLWRVSFAVEHGGRSFDYLWGLPVDYLRNASL